MDHNTNRGAITMPTVRIITFKGCQPTVDLREELEAMLDAENIDADVQLDLVPSPNVAAERGLYGSPTILIDGVELQRERRGPAGFF